MMAAEDMTVEAALSIARVTSGWSETAKEKALRVLAEAYRAERAKSLPRCTCDYAGIEGEWHKPFCEIEGGPHAECRHRIAELESEVRNVTYDRDGAQGEVRRLESQQGEPTGTDWAVRWHSDPYRVERHVTDVDSTGEAHTRRVHAQYPLDTALIQRTCGPWSVSL